MRLDHLSALACAILFGQQGEPRPAFEVTSVKPTPPARQNRLRTDYCSAGGRFSVGGAPVIWSLKYAYRLKDFQISGAPPWLSEFNSSYDIEGKPDVPIDNAQCRLMLQSLFADRFKLSMHKEQKEASVYLLTIGKNGTKLRHGGGVKLNGSVQVTETEKPEWPDGWTMARLSTYLSDFAGRPVIDQTGLTGEFGIALDFSRNDTDNKPTIFSAVQDQLGLKLISGKAPIELFVIDHIEKPSAN